jgi:hypothetical protein
MMTTFNDEVKHFQGLARCARDPQIETQSAQKLGILCESSLREMHLSAPSFLDEHI